MSSPDKNPNKLVIRKEGGVDDEINRKYMDIVEEEARWMVENWSTGMTTNRPPEKEEKVEKKEEKKDEKDEEEKEGEEKGQEDGERGKEEKKEKEHGQGTKK